MLQTLMTEHAPQDTRHVRRAGDGYEVFIQRPP